MNAEEFMAGPVEESLIVEHLMHKKCANQDGHSNFRFRNTLAE